MNYAKIFYKITIHLLRGSSTWSLLHCRSWIGSKRKEAKEGRQIFPRQWCVCTICLDNVPAKQESLRIQRNRGRWIINFIDDMSKIQKVLNLFVRNAETNFGRQSLSHHYVPVSTLEECVIKVVKENTEENDSQGNSRLERTRCNTPKYFEDVEIRKTVRQHVSVQVRESLRCTDHDVHRHLRMTSTTVETAELAGEEPHGSGPICWRTPQMLWSPCFGSMALGQRSLERSGKWSCWRAGQGLELREQRDLW